LEHNIKKKLEGKQNFNRISVIFIQYNKNRALKKNAKHLAWFFLWEFEVFGIFLRLLDWIFKSLSNLFHLLSFWIVIEKEREWRKRFEKKRTYLATILESGAIFYLFRRMQTQKIQYENILWELYYSKLTAILTFGAIWMLDDCWISVKWLLNSARWLLYFARFLLYAARWPLGEF
jgi:hypothetical protein